MFLRAELAALCATCALAPVIAGQVPMDAQPMPPGGFLEGALGGFALPYGARLILGVLVFGGLTAALLTRRVLQAPDPAVAGSTLLFVIALGLSGLWSSYPWASYATWPSWALVGAALFLTVTAVGRWKGVRAVLWSLAGGGAATSAKAIVEYASMRPIEPSYRVFGDWNNPNALAGLLVALVPLGLGLGLTGRRLEGLLGFASSTLAAIALVLTQSRGGFLAAAVGLLTFVVLCVAWRCGRAAAGVAVPTLLALGFGALLTATAPGVEGSPALGRVTSAGAGQEHSAGFRTLLWRTSLALAQDRPMGVGVGTFRFESARPGMVTQTFFAHQAYLQTWAEGGVLALGALLALGLAWARKVRGGMRQAPPERRTLQASVLAATVSVGAHGFVESNLSYLGIGVTAFVLLGIALQLAPDGSAPESTPRPLRHALILLGCLVPFAMMAHVSTVETAKSTAAAYGRLGRETAAAAAERAVRLAPFDGEAWFLLAFLGDGPAALRLERLRQAADLQPTPRYLRALSDAEVQRGNPLSALRALDRALLIDPNNLAALERRYRILDETGELGPARRTARRLLEVEGSTAFRIRALPELVPVETFDARVFLARDERDPEARRRLLREAALGFARYAEVTWPLVSRALRSQPYGEFLGETLAKGSAVLERGRSAAEGWRRLAEAAGDHEDASRATEVASVFTVD